MAINKVVYGNTTLLDLTDTTSTASDVKVGTYFHDATGELVEGEMTDSVGGVTQDQDGYLVLDDEAPSPTPTPSGGIGKLLATESLGALSTSSTTEASTGKSFTLSSDFHAYDLLIVETSNDSAESGKHFATVGVIFLSGGSGLSTKSTASFPAGKLNIRLDANGVAFSNYSSAAYGVYHDSTSAISNGVLTIGMSMRYHSTYTGTLNGNYTTRVYGVNCYGLAGGQ